MDHSSQGGIAVSVIICTYNRSASLSVTLESLAGLTAPEGLQWELLVVDNNSTDSTRDTVEAFAKRQNFPVTYVFEARQGTSFARNSGAERARGEYLAFTDDDVTVDRLWIGGLMETFRRFRCAGLGGRVLPTWSGPPPKWLCASGPFRLFGAIVSFDLGENPSQLMAPGIGANMAFRRDAFLRHGGLRTDLGPKGDSHLLGEDSEFYWRMIHAGELLMYAPQAIVYHPVTPERASKSYFRAWYFQSGKALVQIGADRLPEGARLYWGIPRYLFRQCASDAARWLLGWGTAKRFYYELQLYRTLGMMSHFYRMNQ